MALSRQLDRGRILAGGPQDSSHRALVLPADRRGRHRRPANRPYGDRRAVKIDTRTLGTASAEPPGTFHASSEAWWSRGHASLVEGPDGTWWSMYHGYENGYWTLGRQCLLDPIEFGTNGWFNMRGGDLAHPLAKPRGGSIVPHGQCLSDDFSRPLALGSKWAFFRPASDEAKRLRVACRNSARRRQRRGAVIGLATAGDRRR